MNGEEAAVAILDELGQIRELLARLRELEEERREGERQMEALADALTQPPSADAFDWFRDHEGRFVVRDAATGFTRRMTDEERKLVTASERR